MADTVLGNYSQAVSARCTDKEIRKNAQDGGIETQLLVYALEEGIIDGTIVAGPGVEPWKPEPLVATTREEILSSQHTKFTICPNVAILKEAARSYGLERIGIVGVPCQVQAVRKVQLYPVGMRDIPDKIALVLSTFCMVVYPYQGLVQMVEDHAGVKPELVRRMDFGFPQGKFTVETGQGGETEVPLVATHKYEQPGCHVCLDYVGNLSDISGGSVGSPRGWSTVFIRTRVGKTVWEKALAAGCFETKSMETVEPGLALTRSLATDKITRNTKTLEERKTMGVGKGLRSPYL